MDDDFRALLRKVSEQPTTENARRLLNLVRRMERETSTTLLGIRLHDAVRGDRTLLYNVEHEEGLTPEEVVIGLRNAVRAWIRSTGYVNELMSWNEALNRMPYTELKKHGFVLVREGFQPDAWLDPSEVLGEPMEFGTLAEYDVYHWPEEERELLLALMRLQDRQTIRNLLHGVPLSVHTLGVLEVDFVREALRQVEQARAQRARAARALGSRGSELVRRMLERLSA